MSKIYNGLYLITCTVRCSALSLVKYSILRCYLKPQHCCCAS